MTPDAQARRIPKEVEDTALYNKVADVLDAVDALDDLSLYGQVNVDLYRTYRDSGVGFYLGKQALRFADPVTAQNVLNEMPESWRNREDIKVLEQRIAARVATRPGMTYANVKGQNAQGQPTDLAAMVKPGKYTLVDFWASWCGPCIRQTKVIKELYNKYKDKGLDVVGVAVWDEPENTLKAIKSHDLQWPCIINAQTIPTDLYGISGIPCIILINPEGIIVSRDKQSQALIDDVDNAMASYAPSQPQASVAVPTAEKDTALIF